MDLPDLPTLKYRRLRGDMIEMWKHFSVYEQEILPASFTPLERPSRQHNRQLFQHRPADGVYRPQSNNFYYRAVNTWNRLLSEIVEAQTINAFKSRLDKYWETVDFKFDPTMSPPSVNLCQHHTSAA